MATVKKIKKAQAGYKGSKMANDWYKDQQSKSYKENPYRSALEKSKADTIKLNPPAPRKGGKLIVPKQYKKGGSFPDLNKDGKITKADILKGRGVIAKKGMKVKKAQADKALSPAPSKAAKKTPKQKMGGKTKKCMYGCK